MDIVDHHEEAKSSCDSFHGLFRRHESEGCIKPSLRAVDNIRSSFKAGDSRDKMLYLIAKILLLSDLTGDNCLPPRPVNVRAQSWKTGKLSIDLILLFYNNNKAKKQLIYKVVLHG